MYLHPTVKKINMKTKQNPRDEQTPQTGKVANDRNKVGEQELTQKNQAKRTPDSRTDREAHIGRSESSKAIFRRLMVRRVSGSG